MAQAYSKYKLTSVFALSFLISACASSPSAQYQQKSKAYNFSERTISSTQFEHAVFSNQEVTQKASLNSTLHIYIEGDGQPFIHQRYINQDPTSIKALSLKLMYQDRSPSFLVGRPCYHARPSSNCQNTKWWTSHRYSEPVLNSMAEVINQLAQKQQGVVLIGFSGGGSLAMLLASKVENLKKIITINANLDINAWTRAHAYTPLTGSLNPIDFLEQASSFTQVHLIGERDTNIPHASWLSKVESPKSTIVLYPNFNHTCCWDTVWQQILNQHATDY